MPYSQYVVPILKSFKGKKNIKSKLEKFDGEIDFGERSPIFIMYHYPMDLEKYVELKTKRYGYELSLVEIVLIVEGILRGAVHLFENKIVHRDLHEKNIFVNPCQKVGSSNLFRTWIGDFGLSLDLRKNFTKFQVEKKNEILHILTSSGGKKFDSGGANVPPEIQHLFDNKEEAKLNSSNSEVDILDYSKFDVYSIGKIIKFLMKMHLTHENEASSQGSNIYKRLVMMYEGMTQANPIHRTKVDVALKELLVIRSMITDFKREGKGVLLENLQMMEINFDLKDQEFHELDVLKRIRQPLLLQQTKLSCDLNELFQEFRRFPEVLDFVLSYLDPFEVIFLTNLVSSEFLDAGRRCFSLEKLSLNENHLHLLLGKPNCHISDDFLLELARFSDKIFEEETVICSKFPKILVGQYKLPLLQLCERYGFEKSLCHFRDERGFEDYDIPLSKSPHQYHHRYYGASPGGWSTTSSSSSVHSMMFGMSTSTPRSFTPNNNKLHVACSNKLIQSLSFEDVISVTTEEEEEGFGEINDSDPTNNEDTSVSSSETTTTTCTTSIENERFEEEEEGGGGGKTNLNGGGQRLLRTPPTQREIPWYLVIPRKLWIGWKSVDRGFQGIVDGINNSLRIRVHNTNDTVQ